MDSVDRHLQGVRIDTGDIPVLGHTILDAMGHGIGRIADDRQKHAPELDWTPRTLLNVADASTPTCDVNSKDSPLLPPN
ncbi:MAG: hypothetical protein CMJ18_12945 [Phycisphaeraceae bacterium]|nr:hypothetical protein [Phycisphaeraceae bacterium]